MRPLSTHVRDMLAELGLEPERIARIDQDWQTAPTMALAEMLGHAQYVVRMLRHELRDTRAVAEDLERDIQRMDRIHYGIEPCGMSALPDSVLQGVIDAVDSVEKEER